MLHKQMGNFFLQMILLEKSAYAFLKIKCQFLYFVSNAMKSIFKHYFAVQIHLGANGEIKS